VLLPRLVPEKWALGLLLTGRRIGATEAFRMGLVNEVVPRAELDAAVDRWIGEILACAPLSIRAIKQSVKRTAGLSPAESHLMTELLNARFVDDHGEERTLRDEELLGYIGLLAGAGNETTTRLIGWTAHLLDRFPDQRRLLADDRSLVANAVEEILRYEAPSPVQARYVTRDVELHGTRVPAGSAILMLNGSANRDEREFEDADRLDVRRKNIHHLSFGHGIHFCLGASLARLEGRVALEEVLARWTEWEIDHQGAEMARTSTVRGWKRLPARVQARR